LQQWFRFLKTGYRTAKDCELELGIKHPKETRRIRIGTVSDTVTAEDLVTREEKNKLMKSCDNLRDKAIIDVMDDSGVRPHQHLWQPDCLCTSCIVDGIGFVLFGPYNWVPVHTCSYYTIRIHV